MLLFSILTIGVPLSLFDIKVTVSCEKVHFICQTVISNSRITKSLNRNDIYAPTGQNKLSPISVFSIDIMLIFPEFVYFKPKTIENSILRILCVIRLPRRNQIE